MNFWLIILLTAIGVSHADNAAIKDLRSANPDIALDIINGSKHGFAGRVATPEEREVIVDSLDKIAKNNRSDVWDRLYEPKNIKTSQQQEHILNAYTIITFLQETAKPSARNFDEIFREILDKYFEKSKQIFHVDRKRIEDFSGHILSLKRFLMKDFSASLDAPSEKKLNLDNKRSEHYPAMHLPEAPIIHPYNPFDFNDPNKYRKNGGMLINTFNVRFPALAYMNLPKDIENTLRSHNVSPKNTDIFFITQDNPWKNISLLLRPHTWVQKNGQSVAVQAGIFGDSSVTMDGTANEVHAGTSYMHDGLSSPDNTMVLRGLDYRVTKSFYLVVIDGDRAAVTLMWMLNDEDQDEISKLSLTTKNMQDFMAALKRNTTFDPHLEKLKSLLKY